MIKASNAKCRQYVENCQEFQGNNVYGVWKKGGYVVYSYGEHFPMFLYSPLHRKWYENSDKYSPTTSKQQNQARPRMEVLINNLKGLIQKRTTKELQALIND